jgi:hypothetical protein
MKKVSPEEIPGFSHLSRSCSFVAVFDSRSEDRELVRETILEVRSHANAVLAYWGEVLTASAELFARVDHLIGGLSTSVTTATSGAHSVESEANVATC